MTKKILVTEDLVQEGIDSLTEHGYEVDMLIDPTAEELIGAIAPYDALIVHPNTVVDSSLLDAAENLKIIGRAGVTVDNTYTTSEGTLTVENGEATFFCNGGSVSVWVIEEVI